MVIFSAVFIKCEMNFRHEYPVVYAMLIPGKVKKRK